jgi:hypothetical protein
MVDRIKTLVKSLFQFVKSCKFFTRKIDSTERIAIDLNPRYDPPIYIFNKFGVMEHISDQCDNNTCTCKDRCQVDDMIFYESALLDDYKQKMRESQKRDSGA